MSKGRAFATKATKNAILRFVARGLIARQNDLCRAGKSDAEQLAVYGLAYLKELPEGQDPRFTGC
jgi:hypothetical protein